jgi:hypothetical protein
MHSGTWYAAALGDREARELHPDVPGYSAGAWRTSGWNDWPWEVLARIASAAARVGLREARAVDLPMGYDLDRVEKVLVALEAWLEHRPLPRDSSLRPDFARTETRYQKRQRARWLQDVVHAGVASVWAATRAAGPCFQRRDIHDSDVPRAAQLSILHATSARYHRWKAQPGFGDAALARWHLERMAAADRARAAQLRRRAPGARARSLLSGQPDPSASMETKAVALDARAIQRGRKAARMQVNALDEWDSVCAQVFAEATERVVAWLREGARSFAPNPLVTGTVRVIGSDGIERDVTYRPDGQLLSVSAGIAR